MSFFYGCCQRPTVGPVPTFIRLLFGFLIILFIQKTMKLRNSKALGLLFVGCWPSFNLNLYSNIKHSVNHQTLKDILSFRQGRWCILCPNFFRAGLINPCKLHECCSVGGKKGKLFCNFWFAGGFCANCKCA